MGTIPLSVLGQIQIDVGARAKAAIDAVPYASAVKVGLQFKRRFWEEDEEIIEGSTHTNLHQCRPQKGLRALSLWARAFIRNTWTSLKTASQWLGIACRSRSDVPATGLKKRGQSITTACTESMAGSSWRASTRHTFQHGKRVLSSHRSTHRAAARSCRQNVK
jgi:hypothetical protein